MSEVTVLPIQSSRRICNLGYSYLKMNLPFKKKILKSVHRSSLIFPTARSWSRNLFSTWQRTCQMSSLNETEVNCKLRCGFSIFWHTGSYDERSVDGRKSIAQLWHEVRCMKRSNDNQLRFPLLGRLSAACSTLFHGNADIERMFSKVHDIMRNVKRNVCYIMCLMTQIYIWHWWRHTWTLTNWLAHPSLSAMKSSLSAWNREQNTMLI